MVFYLLALALGIVAGLRTTIVPAAVSWAAYLGLLELDGTWLAFLGNPVTPWILTGLVIVELVVDQLPSTPSRKVPIQFGARIASGALAGAALFITHGSWPLGALVGAVGAVLGTLGGSAFRKELAMGFGRDRPAAFVEDAMAVSAALLILVALP
jgi:uncharacterized membrane protein